MQNQPAKPGEEPKRQVVGQGVRGALQILAPSSTDTLANTFTVDGQYIGAADGTTVVVTLKYTAPDYTNTEQTKNVTVTGEYWSATFTGVSVVAGRTYKVIASHTTNSDAIDGLEVTNQVPIAFEDVGTFNEQI